MIKHSNSILNLQNKKKQQHFITWVFLYFRGFGVAQNSKLAYENYLEAATREVPVAQFEVALMLENGEGCEQNLLRSCLLV